MASEANKIVVTEVRLKLIDNENNPKMKAVASITLNDSFVVSELRVIEGKNGVFVAMPNHRGKDGTYKDTVHPVTDEARREIVDAVIEKYKAIIANREDKATN